MVEDFLFRFPPGSCLHLPLQFCHQRFAFYFADESMGGKPLVDDGLKKSRPHHLECHSDDTGDASAVHRPVLSITYCIGRLLYLFQKTEASFLLAISIAGCFISRRYLFHHMANEKKYWGFSTIGL